MISVGTNILARFYCHDPDDKEALRQAPIARAALLDSPSVFVPVTVLLEFEWVMRGFYALAPEDFCMAVTHLLGMAHITVERWEAVQDAVALHRQGLDFADSLHWACSKHCDALLTFDDRKFVRRAARMGLTPKVVRAV